MNENMRYIIIFVIGIIAGIAGTGFATGAFAGRSAGEVDRLAERNDQLNTEYTERQRIIENGLGQCLGYVENARTITERTGENSSRAIGNLTEAISLIRAGIEERKNIEVELNNLRANLYSIRDINRQSLK